MLSLSDEQQKEMARRLMGEYDKDKKGYICTFEIERMYSDLYKEMQIDMTYQPNQLAGYKETLDFNKDGIVDYNDILMLCHSWFTSQKDKDKQGMIQQQLKYDQQQKELEQRRQALMAKQYQQNEQYKQKINYDNQQYLFKTQLLDQQKKNLEQQEEQLSKQQQIFNAKQQELNKAIMQQKQQQYEFEQQLEQPKLQSSPVLSKKQMNQNQSPMLQRIVSPERLPNNQQKKEFYSPLQSQIQEAKKEFSSPLKSTQKFSSPLQSQIQEAKKEFSSPLKSTQKFSSPLRTRQTMHINNNSSNKNKSSMKKIEDKLKVARKLFNRFDQDKKGLLGPKELQELVGETYKMMGIKGYTMSEMEVTLLLNQIDKEKKGAISLKDYELYTLESLSKSGIQID